jgi:hypothetical protein
LPLATEERRLLAKFYAWLIRRGRSVHPDDKAVQAEFCPEKPEDRKNRLRSLKDKRREGRLLDEERQILDAMERSSIYSNKVASVVHSKPAGRKAQNIEEVKRLWVVGRVRHALRPREDRYRFLKKLYRHAQPQTLLKRMWRFERDCIRAGKLTCQRIVEEQFDRFKMSRVMQEVVDNKVGMQRLRSGAVLERLLFHQELRNWLRRTQLETDVLSKVGSVSRRGGRPEKG